MAAQDILDLTGRAALVTGGGQGAGRGIALAFADHGAAVAVNDFVLERAEAVAEEIRERGGVAVAVQADVSDYASVKAAFDKASKELGAITLLVNNAGMAGPTDKMGRSPEFWEADPSEWPRFFNTNLYGVMNCCHVALPGMVKVGKGGRIVTIVSDSGRLGEQRLAAYAAAKAGAAGFVRSIAKEAGRYGITSNAVSLSTLTPPMSEEQLAEFLETPMSKAQLSQYVIRRYGTPDDVAAMVLFLCSDAASWITGQTYPVNGGYSFTI